MWCINDVASAKLCWVTMHDTSKRMTIVREREKEKTETRLERRGFGRLWFRWLQHDNDDHFSKWNKYAFRFQSNWNYMYNGDTGSLWHLPRGPSRVWVVRVMEKEISLWVSLSTLFAIRIYCWFFALAHKPPTRSLSIWDVDSWNFSIKVNFDFKRILDKTDLLWAFGIFDRNWNCARFFHRNWLFPVDWQLDNWANEWLVIHIYSYLPHIASIVYKTHIYNNI